MPLPRLHIVTDEQIIRTAGFLDLAARLMHAHGAGIALHLRGRTLSGRELFDVVVGCAGAARASGTLLVVNDRVDVALCCGIPAVQLPGHSLDVRAARRVIGEAATIGSSVHSADESFRVIEEGADFLLAGTVFTTPSHPETAGIGVGWLRGVAAMGRPVIAIGGIDAERAGDVVRAGAHGVAVMRAVWSAEDPVAAAAQMLEALAGPGGDRTGSQRGEI